MAGGIPFAGVTAPLEIPVDQRRTPLPEMKEMPGMEDTSTSGLRLQGTAVKALPGIKQAGELSNARELAAAEYARDMSAAFEISKAYQARSRAIARIKNARNEKAAKNFGKR